MVMAPGISEKKKLLIACLPTKHLGVHMNSFKRVRAFQIELEFESVGFRGAKEQRSKGENQQQTQPTYGVDVRLSRTGRRELSPLRHPLLSNKG